MINPNDDTVSGEDVSPRLVIGERFETSPPPAPTEKRGCYRGAAWVCRRHTAYRPRKTLGWFCYGATGRLSPAGARWSAKHTVESDSTIRTRERERRGVSVIFLNLSIITCIRVCVPSCAYSTCGDEPLIKPNSDLVTTICLDCDWKAQ